MTKISSKIVFFGSGPVAAKSLQLLAGTDEFEIEAVVTKPKPEHHRGDFPVITTAESLDLPLLYASNKAEADQLFENAKLESKVGILIDFGVIVSQSVIDYFPLGIVNSHFSLLPEWRGADPITFSILSGQRQTGVSLMILAEAMDEGPLLAQAPFELPPDITTPELTDKLIDLSFTMLKEVMPAYLDGDLQPQPQENVTMAESKQPSYSRKLTKQDGEIDWKKPADQLEREIRAFIDWPKSRTTLGGKEVIVLKARVTDENAGTKPGEVRVDQKKILVQAGDGSLEIEKLKPAGKGAMTAEAFIAGYGSNL